MNEHAAEYYIHNQPSLTVEFVDFTSIVKYIDHA